MKQYQQLDLSDEYYSPYNNDLVSFTGKFLCITSEYLIVISFNYQLYYSVFDEKVAIFFY